MNKIYFDIADEYITHFIRGDGLNVYLWKSKKGLKYSASLMVNYGSNHDEFYVGGKKVSVPTGIAHYLEHLKFNNGGGEGVFEFYLKNSTDVNAFTTFEYTNYYIGGTQNFNKNVKFLHEFVFNNYFTEKLVEKERGIILEEAKSSLDNPGYVLFFQVLKNLFHSIKYRNEVIGSLNDIKNLTKGDLEIVFENFYTPSNMNLILTGNFNEKEAVELINSLEIKSSKKDAKTSHINFSDIEKDEVFKQEDVIYKSIKVPKASIAFKMNINNFHIKDKFLLYLYLKLIFDINFDSTSDFSYDLLKKKLVHDFSYDFYIMENYVVLLFFIEGEKNNKVKEEIMKKVHALKTTEEAFERKKKVLIASEINTFNEPEEINFMIQFNLIEFGQILNNKTKVYETLNLGVLLKIIEELRFDNFVEVDLLKEKSKV